MKSNSFQTNCFEFVKKDFEISTYNVKNKVDNDEYLKKFVSHECFQEEVKKSGEKIVLIYPHQNTLVI